MTVKQASTRQVSIESIMRGKAFRHGVNDVRNGEPPRFDDAKWGDDDWDYEWGRQFGILAPRSLEVVLSETRQLNPEAVEFFRQHDKDICQ